MKSGLRVSPVPCRPPGIRQRHGDEESRHAQVAKQLAAEHEHGGIVQAEETQQLIGAEQEDQADAGRDHQSETRRGVHGPDASLGMARAQVLSGDRGRGAHQTHRSPGDEREELGVADGVGGLRFRAVRERADEAQQEDSGHVHRHALHAGGQPEAKQRADDGPVGPLRHVTGESHDDPARRHQPDAHARCGERGDRRAEGRTLGAERPESARARG